MKRDMELVRKIVFALEEHEHGYFDQEPKIDGYTDDQIGYHGTIMAEAGLILGGDVTGMEDSSPRFSVRRLTWAGHEFADAARNEGIWNQAKTKIAATVGTVSLAVLIEYLKQLAKEQLGLK